jgi:hypothetical protein
MTALSSLKTRVVVVAVAAGPILTAACSDYRGWLGHMTDSEAKIWGAEISVLAQPDPTGISGTYSFTVKYDFRGYTAVPPLAQCPGPNPAAVCTYPDAIVLTSYRNPTVGAFSRDGCVDRDGDDIQGRAGENPPFSCENATPSPTKFAPKWRFIDRNLGCQFFANYDQTFGPPPKAPPFAAVCSNTANEEVDKDLSLQGSAQSNVKEAFANLDDLFNKIWSGALATSFTAEVVQATVNGNAVAITPMSIAFTRNNLRPINMTFDLTTPGGREFLQALLANTENGQPATLSLRFEGGMTFNFPASMILTFNHAELQKIL